MAAPTTNNATTAALNNFDLAEHIMLYLPLREVLLSKRVCKAWKDEVARCKADRVIIMVNRVFYLEPEDFIRVFIPARCLEVICPNNVQNREDS